MDGALTTEERQCDEYSLVSVEACRHGDGWRVVTQLDRRGSRYRGTATTIGNEPPPHTVARATLRAARRKAKVEFANRSLINGRYDATVAILDEDGQEVGTASHLRADEAIALAVLDALKKLRSSTPAHGWD